MVLVSVNKFYFAMNSSHRKIQPFQIMLNNVCTNILVLPFISILADYTDKSKFYATDFKMFLQDERY